MSVSGAPKVVSPTGRVSAVVGVAPLSPLLAAWSRSPTGAHGAVIPRPGIIGPPQPGQPARPPAWSGLAGPSIRPQRPPTATQTTPNLKRKFATSGRDLFRSHSRRKGLSAEAFELIQQREAQNVTTPKKPVSAPGETPTPDATGTKKDKPSRTASRKRRQERPTERRTIKIQKRIPAPDDGVDDDPEAYVWLKPDATLQDELSKLELAAKSTPNSREKPICDSVHAYKTSAAVKEEPGISLGDSKATEEDTRDKETDEFKVIKHSVGSDANSNSSRNSPKSSQDTPGGTVSTPPDHVPELNDPDFTISRQTDTKMDSIDEDEVIFVSHSTPNRMPDTEVGSPTSSEYAVLQQSQKQTLKDKLVTALASPIIQSLQLGSLNSRKHSEPVESGSVHSTDNPTVPTEKAQITVADLSSQGSHPTSYNPEPESNRDAKSPDLSLPGIRPISDVGTTHATCVLEKQWPNSGTSADLPSQTDSVVCDNLVNQVQVSSEVGESSHTLSWQDYVGSVRMNLPAPNPETLSGDHCSIGSATSSIIAANNQTELDDVKDDDLHEKQELDVTSETSSQYADDYQENLEETLQELDHVAGDTGVNGTLTNNEGLVRSSSSASITKELHVYTSSFDTKMYDSSLGMRPGFGSPDAQCFYPSSTETSLDHFSAASHLPSREPRLGASPTYISAHDEAPADTTLPAPVLQDEQTPTSNFEGLVVAETSLQPSHEQSRASVLNISDHGDVASHNSDEGKSNMDRVEAGYVSKDVSLPSIKAEDKRVCSEPSAPEESLDAGVTPSALPGSPVNNDRTCTESMELDTAMEMDAIPAPSFEVDIPESLNNDEISKSIELSQAMETGEKTVPFVTCSSTYQTEEQLPTESSGLGGTMEAGNSTSTGFPENQQEESVQSLAESETMETGDMSNTCTTHSPEHNDNDQGSVKSLEKITSSSAEDPEERTENTEEFTATAEHGWEESDVNLSDPDSDSDDLPCYEDAIDKIYAERARKCSEMSDSVAPNEGTCQGEAILDEEADLDLDQGDPSDTDSCNRGSVAMASNSMFQDSCFLDLSDPELIDDDLPTIEHVLQQGSSPSREQPVEAQASPIHDTSLGGELYTAAQAEADIESGGMERRKQKLEQLLAEGISKKDEEHELRATEEDLNEGLRQGGINTLRHQEYVHDEEVELLPEHKNQLEKFQVQEQEIQDEAPGEPIFDHHQVRHLFSFPTTLTLEVCGFVPGTSSLDRMLTNVDSDCLLEMLSSNIVSMCFEMISCPESFLDWVFLLLSESPSTTVMDACLKLLLDLLQKQEGKAARWVPDTLNVTRALVNYGADFNMILQKQELVNFSSEDLYLNSNKENHDPERNVRRPRDPLPDVLPQPWGGDSASIHENLSCVLRVLTEALTLRSQLYPVPDVLAMTLMILKVSLDTSLTSGTLKHDLRTCVGALLNSVPTDAWKSHLQTLCSNVPSLVTFHHNMLELVEVLPPTSRGLTLQRHLSYVFLNILCFEETPAFAPLKVCQLFPIVQSFRVRGDRVDYYRLSSLLVLLDRCVGVSTLPGSEKSDLQTLLEMLKLVMNSVRDNINAFDRCIVKDNLAQLSSKWFIQIGHMGTKQGTIFQYSKRFPKSNPVAIEELDNGESETAPNEGEAGHHSDNESDSEIQQMMKDVAV